MRDILNQFIIDKQGHFIEVSNSGNKTNKDILWQCMDLAYDFLTALRIPKATIQNTYAYEVFTKPKPITLEYFDLIPNSASFIPQDGDICVFKGGEAGHIGIALSGGNTSKFPFFEENSPLGTNAHISDKSYSNMLGVLRPKIKDTDTLKWLRGMYQERGIDLTLPEGEVRYRVQEIFDSAKKTDELKSQVQKLNTRVEEAEGEVKRLETASANDIQEIKTLKKEVDELKINISNRDAQITTLQGRMEMLEGQIDPQKVVILSKEEFNRLTATKMLDKFTGFELFKEILRRWINRNG
jgi:hypothetical protein